MKQVWPRPDGYTEPAAVCESMSNRLSFSHPRSIALLTLGVIPLLCGIVLGMAGGGALVFAGFGAVGLALAVPGVLGVVNWMREDKIARTGADAWADVTELKAGRTSISFRRPYKVQYRYNDGNGASHEGKVRVIGTSWESYTGQKVLVRYDRERPERSAIVWNNLMDERGIPY